jgi:hypothetical protein
MKKPANVDAYHILIPEELEDNLLRQVKVIPDVDKVIKCYVPSARR